MAKTIERKHPHTWRYCTREELPKYESQGWRFMNVYKEHEEFTSVIVGWFGEGAAPKVRLD